MKYHNNDIFIQFFILLNSYSQERNSELLSFSIEYDPLYPVDFIESVLLKCDRLVRVHLIGFPQIDNERILGNIITLEYLTGLEISGCKNLDNSLLFNLPSNIISLNMSDTNFDGECLMKFPFLGRLNISRCSFTIKNSIVLPLVYHCLDLRELYMSDMKGFTAKDFELILLSQRLLKKLDVSYNKSIIPVISKTSKILSGLRSLNIAFCGEDINLGSLYEMFTNLDELFISGSKLEHSLKEDGKTRFPRLNIVNLFVDEEKTVAKPEAQQEKIKIAHLAPEQIKSNDRIRNARHRKKKRKKAQEDIQKREIIVTNGNDSDLEDGCYF